MKQGDGGVLVKSRPQISVLDFSVDDVKEFLLEKLAGKNVCAAYLIGSFAEGKATAWSDIDVIIVKETELSFPERVREFADFFELGVPFDVFVYTPEEVVQFEAEPSAFWQMAMGQGVRVV